MKQWHTWGRAHDLYHRSNILQITVALLITTILHEVGHASAGIALGMKLRSFHVGPFEWSAHSGKWSFKFTSAKLFSADGSVSLVPQNPRQSRWIEIGMIAAGPITSLITGLAAFGLAVTAKGRPYEQAWPMFALIATMGVIAFVVNLLPLRPDGLYSDGANIYQRLKGGPWADFRAAIAAVMSTTVTPLRPRDFDIEAIQRAANCFTQGREAVLLRLMASSYYLDCAEFSKAAAAIADAEAAFARSPWNITPGLCMTFAFRIALLDRDAVRARVWWERAEVNNPPRGAEYWMANSALLWAENRLDEARAAHEQASVLVAQLHAAGDCDFDRYSCSLLGQAQAEPSPAG
jgi:Zn-dependent protease